MSNSDAFAVQWNKALSLPLAVVNVHFMTPSPLSIREHREWTIVRDLFNSPGRRAYIGMNSHSSGTETSPVGTREWVSLHLYHVKWPHVPWNLATGSTWPVMSHLRSWPIDSRWHETEGHVVVCDLLQVERQTKEWRREQTEWRGAKTVERQCTMKRNGSVAALGSLFSDRFPMCSSSIAV